jgi:D-alanyl-D-alanine carboxypeptidase/D-alanyl-D-alanine-endopeptidase (penicillin-binding protein 4)
MAAATHGGWNRTRPALLVLLVVVLAGGTAVGGYAETRAVRSHVDPTPTRSTTPPPPQLAAATDAPTSAPSTAAAPADAAAVAAELAPLVKDPDLGGRVVGQVVDVATGTVLYDRGGTTAVAPASTAKLMTAAAALTVFGPDDRITTTVVADGRGTVVLLGAGDPTLTSATKNDGPYGPSAARIADLAAQLTQRKVEVKRIVVDGSLFSGPSVSPQWSAGDVPTDYASPITAVMVDGGRNHPADYIRSGDPDLAAGRALAAALGRPSLQVVRGTASAAARASKPLAGVQSMPMSDLVVQMLLNSDNVIAEVLGRLVALKQGGAGSFTGAAAAIRAVLSHAGVPTSAALRDASGLAASDRVPPAELVAVLRLAATPGSAAGPLLQGLPVAGWSGTLADRFPPGTSADAGVGTVRAKTGTLTGVSSLAGVVHAASGRLLAFAFVADKVSPTDPDNAAAEAALDQLAAALAG